MSAILTIIKREEEKLSAELLKVRAYVKRTGDKEVKIEFKTYEHLLDFKLKALAKMRDAIEEAKK